MEYCVVFTYFYIDKIEKSVLSTLLLDTINSKNFFNIFGTTLLVCLYLLTDSPLLSFGIRIKKNQYFYRDLQHFSSKKMS